MAKTLTPQDHIDSFEKLSTKDQSQIMIAQKAIIEEKAKATAAESDELEQLRAKLNEK